MDPSGGTAQPPVIASVPVALPATFTLATALGAMELARGRALVTRLSAIEEAAGMDVLCVDKTGTITENCLTVADRCLDGAWTAGDLLRFAALASDEATQDPIDLAVLRAAHDQRVSVVGAERTRFIPFDPSSKRSEALVRGSGRRRSCGLARTPPRCFGTTSLPASSRRTSSIWSRHSNAPGTSSA